MSAWLAHLGLHSLGLCAVGLVVACALRRRADPELGYRAARLLLWTALALPCAQLAVSGRLARSAAPLGTAAARTAHSPSERAPAPVDLAVAGFGQPAPEAASRLLPFPLPFERPTLPEPALAPTAPELTSGPTSDLLFGAISKAPRAAFGRLQTVLLATYAAGVLVALALVARRARATRRLLRACRPLEDPGVHALWTQLVARAARSNPPSRIARARIARARLVTHPTLPSPGCWGLVTPVVLVPERALEPTRCAALECALAHELVHIERGDAWSLLGELALGVVLWFHPVAHWLKLELGRLRETSCDLAAVRRTGRARSYALALLDAACFTPTTSDVVAPAGATLLHWSHSQSHLRRRIDMLARHANRPFSKSGLPALPWAAALALSAAASTQLAAAAVLLPAVAQTPEAPAPVPSWAPTAAAPRSAAPPAAADELGEFEALLSEFEELAARLESEAAPGPRSPQAPPLPRAPVPPAAPPRAQELAESSGFYAPNLTPAGVVRMAPAYAPHSGAAPRNGDRRLGIGVGTVSEVLAAQLDLNPERSVVVEFVEPGSAAEQAGLRAHDVLLETTLDELRAALHEADPDGSLRLEVLRSGQPVRIAVPIETSRVEASRAAVGAAPSASPPHSGFQVPAVPGVPRMHAGEWVRKGGATWFAPYQAGKGGRWVWQWNEGTPTAPDGERTKQQALEFEALEWAEELSKRGELDRLRGLQWRERARERAQLSREALDVARQRIDSASGTWDGRRADVREALQRAIEEMRAAERVLREQADTPAPAERRPI